MLSKFYPHASTSAVVIAFTASVTAGPNTAIPLTITFADAPLTSGISGDGGAYVHKAEGKVPTVALNGIIELDTRGSSRTACFNFDGAVMPGAAAALAPQDICAPVLLRTLAGDNGSVGDQPVGGSLDFGMDVYWIGPAQAGGSYQYVLEYKRVEGNGVTVTHPDADTWTVQNILNARVSVYQKGKGAGWSVVGTYDMPVNLTAIRNQ